MKRLIIICAVASIVAVGAQVANAAIITSSGDAALAGATVIDFEGQTLGSYTTLGIGDVTFTANNNHLQIGSTYAGNYSTTGRLYLDNGTYGNNGFSTMTIDFATDATAFGFNWGAAESWSNWSLVAYDASNAVLDSYAPLPNTGPGNAGTFVGVSDATGIDHAVLSTTTAYDWIFVDNFTYNVVPVPGAFLLGVIGLGVVSRRLRRRETA